MSDFLADVDAAWTRRREAIRQQTRSAATQQIDPSDDDEERIILAFGVDAHRHVTVIVRASRWTSIVAVEGTPELGWAWQFSDSGRLTSDPATLIEAIEQTLSACSGMTAGQTSRLDAIWQPLLANGPQAVG